MGQYAVLIPIGILAIFFCFAQWVRKEAIRLRDNDQVPERGFEVKTNAGETPASDRKEIDHG